MTQRKKRPEHETLFIARYRCDVDVLVPIVIKASEHPDVARKRAKIMYMEETPLQEAIEAGRARVQIAPGGVKHLLGVSGNGEAS